MNGDLIFVSSEHFERQSDCALDFHQICAHNAE